MPNTINIERLKNIILKNSATHAEFMTITSMLLAYMVPNDTTPNNTHNKPSDNDDHGSHTNPHNHAPAGQHCHDSSLYKNGTLTHEGTNPHDHSATLIKLLGTQFDTSIPDTELCSLMRQVARELIPNTLSLGRSETICSLIPIGLLKLARTLLDIAADRIK
ncbi:hypothetical protein AAEY45_002428 [Yersinia enterocolitica]